MNRRGFLAGLLALAAAPLLPARAKKWRQVLYVLPPPLPSRRVVVIDSFLNIAKDVPPFYNSVRVLTFDCKRGTFHEMCRKPNGMTVGEFRDLESA